MADPLYRSGIYAIENIDTGRQYIGSAVRISKRWTEHRRTLDTGKHHSKRLMNSWRKRGAERFQFRVLLFCDRADLLFYEQRALDAYKPEYNTDKVAGSRLGSKASPESKARMSASHKGQSSPMKGMSHSAETKAKISESRKGKGGGKRTAERRANISAALKGREVSQEQRAKISAKLMGHKQSPEQIEKRTAKLRGRKMPEGFGAATSIRLTGRKLDAAHCVSIGRSKAKLSDEQIISVRLLRDSGMKRKDIASMFDIDPASITAICNGTSYRWVK